MSKLLSKLPPFVFAKAFWEAISFLVSGVLALLAFFHVISGDYALSAGAILLFILAILRFFKIEPELKLDEVVSVIKAIDEIEKESARLDLD